MAVVAVTLHDQRDQAADLARRTVRRLAALGHSVRLCDADADVLGISGQGCRPESLPEGLDLAVSLGGDGTMLRTVDLVAAAGVPVMGVNVGQMGYLTEVEPSGLDAALDRFFAGDYGIEERMMLRIDVEPVGGERRALTALNEAVVEKTATGHTVRLDVEIDGDAFTSYAADGLIVATPTGSTAYSLSARGPIVSPRHRAVLLTPVSPHMLFDRSLVLDPEETVRIAVAGHREAILSVDGRVVGELRAGDAICCRGNDQPARFVTFGPRRFHRILKAKFGLADR